MTDWIARKDREPEKDGAYIVCARSADPKNPLIAIAWYDPRREDGGWSLLTKGWCDAITHWMPLPKPPEEK